MCLNFNYTVCSWHLVCIPVRVYQILAWVLLVFEVHGSLLLIPHCAESEVSPIIFNWNSHSSVKILQRDVYTNLHYCTSTHSGTPVHKIHTWRCLFIVWNVCSFTSLGLGSWDQSLLNSGKAHRSLGGSEWVCGTEETDADIRQPAARLA